MNTITDWLSRILLPILALVGWTFMIRNFPNLISKGIVSFVDHRYDRKLEELKGEITTKNTAMQSTVSFLAASQPGFRSKVFSSVESLWIVIENIQKAHTAPTGLLALLRPDELHNLFGGKQGNIALVLEEYKDLETLASAMDKAREHISGSEILYVNNRLWTLYEAAFHFHNRVSGLIHKSLKDKNYYDWRHDELAMRILRHAFSDDRTKDIANQTSSPKYVIDLLKAEFIKEARNVVRGKTELESVAEIHSTLTNLGTAKDVLQTDS